MNLSYIEQLAIEGSGAIQVEASPDKVPPIITMGGCIKFWWSEGQWDTPLHKQYVQWRSALEARLVKEGFVLYMPYKSIRGKWNERLQRINDMAIKMSDVFVNMTPAGVPADGTQDEIDLATKFEIPVVWCPPSDEAGMEYQIRQIKDLTKHLR